MEVWRGGISTRYIKEELSADPTVASGGAHDNDRRPGMKFRFEMRSKGGGKSKVIVWVTSAAFKQVAAKMMAADPALARKAFLKSMLDAEK
jgi:hypothetical protein